MDTKMQNAYEHGVNQLGLHDVDIRVGMNAELDVFGTATIWEYDDGRIFYVIALLPQIVPSLIQTLGHELYHVWEFENLVPTKCTCADAYGYQLLWAVGGQLVCDVCGKPMTEHEADESEIGSEFIDELVCDGCFANL